MTQVDGRAERARVVPARGLNYALFLYVGWFVLCAGVALGRAAHFRGRLYLPAQGDRYTAAVDIWPGALRPLGGLVMWTAFLGPYLAVVLVVLAVFRLTDHRVRARRGTWIPLLVGAVLVGATVAVTLSSPGQTLRGWILD